MASIRQLDYGWFLLRLALGLFFLQAGAAQLNTSSLQLVPVVLVICGSAIIVGLLVRPAALGLLVLNVMLFVSGGAFVLSLGHRSLIELFASLGFLIGGGGSFLALGAAISGLRNRWYQ